MSGPSVEKQQTLPTLTRVACPVFEPGANPSEREPRIGEHRIVAMRVMRAAQKRAVEVPVSGTPVRTAEIPVPLGETSLCDREPSVPQTPAGSATLHDREKSGQRGRPAPSPQSERTPGSLRLSAANSFSSLAVSAA